MSESSTPRVFVRHTVATLAYRLAKAVRGAPDTFASYRAGDSTRTPILILAHIGDLFDWALWMAKGKHEWSEATPLPWNEETVRVFAALARFDEYLASDQPLGWPAEQLFQGPIADALTHTGQLTMLRRLAGAPIRGENYAKAEIEVGRVGLTQQAPRREFD
jgi:hypothetical protein